MDLQIKRESEFYKLTLEKVQESFERLTRTEYIVRMEKVTTSSKSKKGRVIERKEYAAPTLFTLASMLAAQVPYNEEDYITKISKPYVHKGRVHLHVSDSELIDFCHKYQEQSIK
ncbi:MAG: hypothetical protein Q7S74_04825 [Nanoarchaeota archaeon]|nr:hypothetical protein [Nanoarchaeota archaeon]